jgi:hypothetical protein
MAFDKNIKEWNFVILFKFNGKFDVVMSAVEIREKFNSSVLIGNLCASERMLGRNAAPLRS